MIVQKTFKIKGRGLIVVVKIDDDEFVKVGDKLISSGLEYKLVGVEMSASRLPQNQIGIIIKNINHLQELKDGDILKVVSSD